MNTVMTARADQDYADIAFALKCIESGQAKNLRLRAGLSKNDMARRVDILPPYVQRWEDGTHWPSRRSLDALIAYGRELRKLSEDTNN